MRGRGSLLGSLLPLSYGESHEYSTGFLLTHPSRLGSKFQLPICALSDTGVEEKVIALPW